VQQSSNSRPAKIAETKFKPYRLASLRYIADMRSGERDPCVAITNASPEWEAWADWFVKHFGEMPWEFKSVALGLITSATVPCQWPEYLDATFARVMDDHSSKPMPAPRSIVRHEKPRTPRVERAFRTLAQTLGHARPASTEGEAA
jgi:hypothetical protein